MKFEFNYIRAQGPVLQDHEKHRPVLYYHIPRCGGTTLRILLQLAASISGRQIKFLTGTVYGQFLGPGKTEAAQGLSEIDFSKSPMVIGHVPWVEECQGDVKPLALTLLRDPAERMVSQFKRGVLQGGWNVETPIHELIDRGLIVGNTATRMLAGLGSVEDAVDDTTLQVARDNLARTSAAGDLARFTDFCGVLLGAFGCPDVLLVSANQADVDLSPEVDAGIRAASADIESYDVALFEAVRGNVFSNNVEIDANEGQSPHPNYVLMMPDTEAGGGIKAVTMAKSELASVESFLKAQLPGHDVTVNLPQAVS